MGAVRTTPKFPVEPQCMMKALFILGTMVVYGASLVGRVSFRLYDRFTPLSMFSFRSAYVGKS